MKAWQPILTPKTVLPLFFAVGIIFAPIGGLLLWASALVQEMTIDYSRCTTDAPVCNSDNTNLARIPSSATATYFKNSTDPNDAPTWCQTATNVSYHGGLISVNTSVCRVQFQIPDRIGPPILMYYQLTNFYQNHRRYVKSFDQGQLAGQAQSVATTSSSDCSPLDIDNEAGKPYYPCGLIANSLFNDTFSSPLALNWPGSPNTFVNYTMSNKGIAWSSDADLYKPTAYDYSQVVPPPNWRVQYPAYNSSIPFKDLHNDEAFQVWMRTAGLPTFSKLALRNDTTPMEIGRYEMDIYDCESQNPRSWRSKRGPSNRTQTFPSLSTTAPSPSCYPPAR